MQTTFTNIPIFVISTSNRAERRAHMTAQLTRLGLKFVFIEGIQCQPPRIGCALSHLKTISAPEAIPPFLVLEDDCTVSGEFTPAFEIPVETDAIYFGVSHWGYVPEIFHGGIPNATVATRYNEHFLRVHNMLSSHAIAYFSMEFIHAARLKIMECVLNGAPFDIGMAQLQQTHRVLTPTRPFFFQDGRFGGQESATRAPLRVVSGKPGFVVEKAGDSFHVRLVDSGTTNP